VLTRPSEPNEAYYGFPALPQREWRRAVAHFAGLDKLVKRINHALSGAEPADSKPPRRRPGR